MSGSSPIPDGRLRSYTVFYILAAVIIAAWFAVHSYNESLEELTKLSEATSIFSNLLFALLLLMGFGVIMLKRIGRQL